MVYQILHMFNYIHAEGSQAARVVAGSVVGCVLLLLLAVASVTIRLVLKQKGFTLSTNSNCMGKQEANIVTEDNIAYRSKSIHAEVLHASNNIALEVVYDNVDLQSTDSMEESMAYGNANLQSTDSMEENMAYGNADLQSTDSMEENMAYESFTMDEISLRSNAAYYKSGRALREESDCTCDISNQYEYISSRYS